MECPNGHKQLEKMLFHQVEVDYCPECLGIWFDQDELAMAKNDKDGGLNWVDVDLWRDKSKFGVLRIDKRCPVCRIPFFQVTYDQSKVRVDYCKKCKGMWLDRGEFKQIVIYLIRKSDYELLHHYTKNLVLELWEVFSGPEAFRSELEDFLMILKLFNYKFLVQHPRISALIRALPQ